MLSYYSIVLEGQLDNYFDSDKENFHKSKVKNFSSSYEYLKCHLGFGSYIQ